ncbi:hypothetical protein LTR57_004893 [Friedmanniomyces endolithicus]|nr:hypothetical protein LTR57_004893 [Friedmanniomyces endolithicus]
MLPHILKQHHPRRSLHVQTPRHPPLLNLNQHPTLGQHPRGNPRPLAPQHQYHLPRQLAPLGAQYETPIRLLEPHDRPPLPAFRGEGWDGEGEDGEMEVRGDGDGEEGFGGDYVGVGEVEGAGAQGFGDAGEAAEVVGIFDEGGDDD